MTARLLAVLAGSLSGCVHLSVAVEGVEPDPGRQVDAALRTLAEVVAGSIPGALESAVVPMNLMVRFENTGSVGVTVRRVAFRVEVSDIEVGRGASGEAVVVPAGECRTARIPFEVRLAGLGPAGMSSWSGVRFNVTGEARVETGVGSRAVAFRADRLAPVMEVREK